MSSFVWPPLAAQIRAGQPQEYVVGSTFTGLILGGSGSAEKGWTVTPSGGLTLGGTPAIEHFNVFFTYRYFPDGGLILGGEGKLPAKFAPDEDFVSPKGTWTDDPFFPGENIGGN